MDVNVEQLLESGVHFGHRVSRRNPKMEPFIYGKRNMINIIDLRETLRGLVRACNLLEKLASGGAQVLFVGTKRQAKSVVRAAAQQSGMHWVTERWLGGSMTNFGTVRSRLKRLEELESMEDDGSIHSLSKKMISSLSREKRKIKRNLEGMRKMERLPEVLVVVDPRREHNAVREARKLDIPIVALLDTDCDPAPIDVPIPGNDDAMRSIELVVRLLTNAILEGKKAHKAGAGLNLRELMGVPEKKEESAIPSKEELKRQKRGRGGGGRLHRSKRADDAPPTVGRSAERPSKDAPKDAAKDDAKDAKAADSPAGDKQEGAEKPEAVKSEAVKSEAKPEAKDEKKAAEKTAAAAGDSADA